jgi:hypothetical protein
VENAAHLRPRDAGQGSCPNKASEKYSHVTVPCDDVIELRWHRFNYSSYSAHLEVSIFSDIIKLILSAEIVPR